MPDLKLNREPHWPDHQYGQIVKSSEKDIKANGGQLGKEDIKNIRKLIKKKESVRLSDPF